MDSTSATPWTIRVVAPTDEAAWRTLYRGYRAFYRLDDDEAVLDRTWRWVVRGEHGFTGLVAAHEDGGLGAIAHLRRFARPSSGSIGLYLDDLFTDPGHRGQGLGGALLGRARTMAADEGATVVRWITDDGNAVARSLYDANATATSWVTYDMAPAVAR